MPRPSLLQLALVLGALAAQAQAATGAPARDRRVVDTVHAGDARSEAAHGYWGGDAQVGTADGVTHREARGWMRYALTTFDDTEVTVSCTFAAHTDARRFELVVEDSVIATPITPPSAEPRVVNVVVPLTLTRGKTNIAVAIRARDGLTPPLRELRTVQDHNELDHQFDLVPSPLGATR